MSSTLQNEMAFNIAAEIAEFGCPVTLRNVTTLPGPSAFPNPFVQQSLAIDGSFAGGATAVNIRGAGINGRLIPGDQLVIGLDATTYVVAGQATSAANRLVGIGIAPGLVLGAPDGTSVAISFAADYPITGLVTSFPARLVINTAIQQGDRQLRFLASSITWVPAVTDKVFIDGDQFSIIQVKRVSIQGSIYAYYCQIRGGYG